MLRFIGVLTVLALLVWSGVLGWAMTTVGWAMFTLGQML